MKFILIGAPGTGKGTKAKLIAERLKIPHISTGDLFREHVRNNTKYAEQINSYISKGNLVPDELTIKLLNERLKSKDCKKGYILDGFPRNIEQAKKIDEVNHVLLFDCDANILVSRLTARRICKNCGEIYNLESIRPKKEGKCDKCTSVLIHRDDDKEEVIRDRLKIYEKQTKPLLNFFKDKIKKFDANSSVEESKQEILNFLEEMENDKNTV